MSHSTCRRGFGWKGACLALVIAGIVGIGFACETPSHPNQVEIDKVLAQAVSYPLTFVMMGDSRTPGAAAFAEMRSQIQQLSPTPRFVIDNGDLVLTGASTEFPGYVDAIAGYPIPFLSVIGNHEMYISSGRQSYNDIFGAEDNSFDFGNSRFIYMENAVVGSYGLTDAQLAWLEAKLAAPTPPDKFVFMHVPPTLPTTSAVSAQAVALNIPGDDQYSGPDGGVLAGIEAFPNWNELLALIEAYGVKIACFSHSHIYQHSFHAGVNYVITGGAGAETGIITDNPPDYGVFHHFLVTTINADGNSKVELIKKGAGTTPDTRYGFTFQTTPGS